MAVQRAFREHLDLVAILLLVVTIAPFARAQGTGTGFRIGSLNESWGITPNEAGLRDGLVERGYRENVDFFLGVRFTQGDSGALYEAARQLVEQGVDVIFTVGDDAARAARQATKNVPIVFYLDWGDPVDLGLVESRAQPGGNVTGITSNLDPRKRLVLFQEMIPTLQRVLFVYHVDHAHSASLAVAYRDAAERLGIVLVEKPVRDEGEARRALEAIASGDVDGILAPDELNLNIPGEILKMASERAIPAMYVWPFLVRGGERGGLVSFGPDLYEGGRQAARLVAMILEGRSPATIPVEADPVLPELVINMKAAEALDLTIPDSVLIRADEVIQ